MWVAGWLRRTEEPQETTNAESGGASITLRRNGHVEIEGDLFINGAMYVPPVS